MLSPGQLYRRVPKEPRRNLQWRLYVLKRARNEPKLRKALLEYCARDIVFWIDTCVIQFNPMKDGSNRVGPFICWDFQEESLLRRPEKAGDEVGILWCYEKRKTCVVEKSREMGASWLFLMFQVWLAIFCPWSQFLNISRSAEAVDCASPDSLFWKLRFINEHLPDWMKGEVVQKKMYVEYRRSRSVITGQASTGRAGVGGRASVIFIDEFSQITEDTEVRQRTASTSDCRFFNGTHIGVGTEFYNLTHRSPEIPKIRMHWTRHPEKNKGLYRYHPSNGEVEILDKAYAFPPDFKFVMDSTPTGGPFPLVRSPWYDEKVIAIGDQRGAAMDLDIDPQGAASQFFNAIEIHVLIDQFACDPFWQGDVHVDKATGKRSLVKHENGRLKLWCNLQATGRPPEAPYSAGADIALGTGSTPSCLSIVNCKTGEKVAEYTDAHISPEDFAGVCLALCNLFADREGQGAFFVWEMAGPGLKFGSLVVESGYANYYKRVDEFDLKQEVSDKPGWYPNAKSKLVLLQDYRQALHERHLINRSEAALLECKKFEYTGRGSEVAHAEEARTDDPLAGSVNHGDHVIADALAWKGAKERARRTPKVIEHKPPPSVLSLEGRRALWEQQRQLAEEM